MAGSRQLVRAGLLVFVAHVAFLILVPPVPLTADAAVYHELAQRLLGGLGYSLDGQPITDLMPGYPFFIAGIYAVFGPHPWAVRVFQAACLAVATCLLSVLVGRRWGDRAGRIAFWTIAVLPAWFMYPGTLNAETLLLLCEVVFLFVALGERQTLPWAGASGAVCGLLTLVKPEFLMWLPLPALLARRGRRVLTLALATACFAAVLAPWTIRNALTFHRFIPLSTKTGHSLWLSGHQPELTEFSAPEFAAALRGCEVPGDPRATDDCLLKDARRQVASHPAYFIKTSVGRVVHTLFGSNTDYLRGLTVSFSEALHKRQFFILAAKGALLLIHTIFVLVGLAGIAWLCRDRRHWFLLYLLGTKLAVHAVLFGTARYGLHLSPLFAAGWGGLLGAVLARLRARHAMPAAPAPSSAG